MIKLILMELKKISKKKSILVMMVIMFCFNILNNFLFYKDYDNDGNYKYLETENLSDEERLLKSELKKYNYNEESDLSRYIDLKTKLDVIKLKKKYQNGTWQYNKIDAYLYNVLERINLYTYQIKDEDLLNNEKIKLSKLLEKFKNDDWKYFVNIEITNLSSELVELENSLKLIKNNQERIVLEEMIVSKRKDLKDLRYRIENNITYDDSYINQAFDSYNNNLKEIDYMEENINKLSLKELVLYQNIKESLEINKYILKNKINYNKQNNLSYQLRTIVDDYEIFIIILILIVASTIVAEEFTNGTIKLLLIKPYSRGKILLSKYFAIIIFLGFIILYLILLEIIVGGYIFGFSSLRIPVIVYNFSKMVIVEYNIFIYMLIRIVTKLPMLIMISTISFSLSVIVHSVSMSIVIPLFIYIFTPSINYLIVQYKINNLKYLVNINWEFNNYIFGRRSEILGLNFRNSVIIFSIYFIGIMIVTYINFKKKNIKNV